MFTPFHLYLFRCYVQFDKRSFFTFDVGHLEGKFCHFTAKRDAVVISNQIFHIEFTLNQHFIKLILHELRIQKFDFGITNGQPADVNRHIIR